MPVISKLADATSQLDANALSLLDKDIFAADLYEQICAGKSSNASTSDYTQNIVLM